MTASRENRDMESTTAGTLVTTGLKRSVNGPCWNLNLRFPACTRTQRTNAVSSSLVLFQVRRKCLSFHLKRTCLSWHRFDELCGHPIRQNSLLFIFLVLSHSVHAQFMTTCMAQDFKVCVVRVKTSSSPCHPCLHLRIPLACT